MKRIPRSAPLNPEKVMNAHLRPHARSTSRAWRSAQPSCSHGSPQQSAAPRAQSEGFDTPLGPTSDPMQGGQPALCLGDPKSGRGVGPEWILLRRRRRRRAFVSSGSGQGAKEGIQGGTRLRHRRLSAEESHGGREPRRHMEAARPSGLGRRPHRFQDEQLQQILEEAHRCGGRPADAEWSRLRRSGRSTLRGSTDSRQKRPRSLQERGGRPKSCWGVTDDPLGGHAQGPGDGLRRKGVSRRRGRITLTLDAESRRGSRRVDSLSLEPVHRRIVRSLLEWETGLSAPVEREERRRSTRSRRS